MAPAPNAGVAVGADVVGRAGCGGILKTRAGAAASPLRGSGDAMWISRRTDYATRAVLALSLAGGGPLKIDEIARRTAVPGSVLEQVLPTMRNAGIVRSERGQAGGYRLNKAPADITLERIVRLFQGPLAPIGCATRHEPEACAMAPGCSMQDVWKDVRDATIEILQRTTFAELAERAHSTWHDGPLPGAPSAPPEPVQA